MRSELNREPPAKRSVQPPWHQRALQALTNWCLFTGGASALIIGALSALHGEATLAGIAWGAGVLLLLGATIDRFESLKGLGIEAKTRQIDAKLAEADDALERIRELSELTGANLIFLHSKVGRWDDGPSAAEGYAVAQEVKANLTQAGSSDEAIRAALDPWVRTTCGDILIGHARALAKRVQHQIGSIEHRGAASLVMDPEHPETLRLLNQIEQARAFVRRLDDVRSIDFETLPGSFLKLYDEVPLVGEAEVAAARAEADSFMPVIVRIRDELALPEPARWCAAIDQLLERAARND